MKSFSYVNNRGFNKMETTGVLCGTGYKSKYDLNEFFTHYGIDFQFPEDE